MSRLTSCVGVLGLLSVHGEACRDDGFFSFFTFSAR
jgi:hypothetical protein